MPTLSVLFVSALLTVSSAQAAALQQNAALYSSAETNRAWQIDWLSIDNDATPITASPRIPIHSGFMQADAQPVHAVAVEHSDAYLKRAKIHRIASWATLPLFAAELALGTSIYNGVPHGDWKKGAHGAVGAAIVGLFGVNTVTGAWNLFGEGWNDKGRGLRLLHGLLMMAADAGFVATSMSTPSEHRGFTFVADRNTHRNLALASIGVGTTGYLVMLFGNH